MDIPETDDLPLGYEQPDLMDRLLAFFLGAAATGLFFFLSQPLLHPSVWQETSVAFGLQPPEKLFPGLGMLVSSMLFRLCGATNGLVAVKVAGAVCGGASAALFYLMLREFLPAVLSLRSPSRLWTLRLERLVAAVGTATFVCAEPVSRLFQALGGEALLLLLTLAFARMFLRLLHYGRFSTAYICLFLLGVLSAESPFGLLLTAFALVATLVARRNAWRPDLRYLNPMLVELSKWRLSIFFVLGFASACAADVAFFAWRGGLEASGLDFANLAVEWIVTYGKTFWNAATILGWLLLILFSLLPFAVATLNARRATDDDSFLPFKTGILFVVLFVVAAAPLSTFPHLRFWAWTAREVVPSGLLLALAVLALAVTFTLALAVMAFDVWCRDHRRIALQRFPELIEDGAFARQHFHWRWRRTITVLMLALIAFAVVPGRRELATWRLATLVRDTVRETVRECRDASLVVTDGSLDPALRLAAAAEGRSLAPLSIMSGRTPYERWLRRSVAANDEERATLELGVSDALRNWAIDQPDRLRQLAVQIGFELWRARRAERPPASGLVAWAGFSPEAIAKGTAVAQELAERAIAAHKDGSYARCEDRAVKEKFLFSQWRLARLAVVRSEDADRAGDVARSRKDAELVETLDELNPELRRIREAIRWIRSRDGDSLTPREGLRIALERADFALARRYATPILTADPTHPDANFGMGMSYFVEEKYAQAEPYLKTSLIRRPDEPAVLNNLAICHYRAGRIDEALAYSRKALAKLPDAPAVRKTYDEILKAAEARKKAAAVEK